MSKESNSKFSRRNFLNVLALGTASVVFAPESGLTATSKSMSETLPDPGVETYNSLHVLRGIKNKYGVEIPLSESSEFAREVGGKHVDSTHFMTIFSHPSTNIPLLVVEYSDLLV